MNNNKKYLIIIDGHALIHRAYHALPRLTTKKGELVNAVYGFLLVFLKIIREFQPDYIAAVFDTAAPTFRHKKFKEYKIKRIKLPDEFYRQIPKIKKILKSFNISIFEKPGFEADDIVGAISVEAPKQLTYPGIETIILSGDLDVLQLINENTKVYFLRRGLKDVLIYDKKTVGQKYGFPPSQLNDFKALKGDQSDNIPGVRGIGEKTATSLIKDFGSIENLYKNLESSGGLDKYSKRIQEVLKKYKKQAFLSKILTTIEKNIPLNFNLENCRLKRYDKNKTIKLLEELEFYTLIDRLPPLPLSKSK